VYTGWHVEAWHPDYDGKREQFSFGFLRRGEFKGYLTGDFWRALAVWRRYCRYGLPGGRGWTEEPAALLDLFDLFDDARDALDRRRITTTTPGAGGNRADKRRTAGSGRGRS
jgi:hypothetical protein